jgi:hypothetical protein
MKMYLAATYLEGHAATWWRSVAEAAELEGVKPCGGSWHTFRQQLISLFKPVNSVKIARDKIAYLRQQYSVAKYNFDFLTLCIEIGDISKGEQLDKYVRGLKPEVRRYVELARPVDLKDAMEKAQDIDNIDFSLRKVVSVQGGNPRAGGSGGGYNGDHRDNRTFVPMDLGAVDGNRDNAPTRPQQVSREEFTRCRKNGLCLICKKQGHIARNCSMKQIQGKGKAQ